MTVIEIARNCIAGKYCPFFRNDGERCILTALTDRLEIEMIRTGKKLVSG